MLGEFVFPLVFPTRLLSSLNVQVLNRDLVADGCGLVYQLRDPIFDGKAVQDWFIASFCLTVL